MRLDVTIPLALAVVLLATPQPAQAACIPVSDVTQLQAIASDPTGTYCLTQDIDASSVANFQPIENFSGELTGGGHVIRNLTVRTPESNQVISTGLFGAINGGSVQDLGLVNVKVKGPFGSYVGALAGQIKGSPSQPGTIGNAYATGNVAGDCEGRVGGLVGRMSGNTTLENTWSSARVSLICAGSDIMSEVGGLVGELGAGATIMRSFATGRVFSTGGNPNAAGGLVGHTFASTLSQSFAAGAVATEGGGYRGGLVGVASNTTITQSFALGPVTGTSGGPLGGLIGWAEGTSGAGVQVTQTFAAGHVSSSGAGRFRPRGLIGRADGGLGATVSNSYWDADTTGQTKTDEPGVPFSTNQLQRGLPPGFASAAWGITAQHSYPYLPGMALIAPLSTVVHSDNVFVFLPIGQRDPWEYRTAPMHADEASQAAAFTMVARAIGTTNDIAQLRNAKIDGPFWDDAAQMASFRGPVTQYAMLGQLTPIPAATPIGSNVVGPMKLGKLVLLRGTYRRPDHTLGTQWLLGTLFTRNPDRTLAAIVALDPWTGAQVMVDPTTKAVVSPAPFPLRNFRVNGFQPVMLK